ncbi:VIT1/CCC1 transporter family protein, partial [Streptomyces sp. NPDC004561]
PDSLFADRGYDHDIYRDQVRARGIVLLALAGLFGCGAVVARVTARSWWFSGLRQLALGGAAAGVTYALGILFGTAVG